MRGVVELRWSIAAALLVVALVALPGAADHGQAVVFVGEQPGCPLLVTLDRRGPVDGVASWEARLVWAGPDCGGTFALHVNTDVCTVLGTIETGFAGECRDGPFLAEGTGHPHGTEQPPYDVHSGLAVQVGPLSWTASLAAPPWSGPGQQNG